jgi:serine/threonine-protein kinase
MSEVESVLDPADRGAPLQVGRYVLHRQIARGGMATIHIARLMGDEGFSRIVAAKRLLPEFAQDVDFVAMFLDEARIASRVHHRNVVPVLDVVNTGDEVVLVQEYIHGAPLNWLLNKARQTKSLVPVTIAISVACQVLAGLHAAHETTDEMGARLDVVHRDVSPQNVMIAADGTARLLDFGVAKSLMAAHITREGTYKGKLAYSAPEQLRGLATRQSDIYSLSVLLWELLVGHRMHRTAQAEAELVATIMNGKLPTITEALAAEREWEAIDAEHWHELQVLAPIIERGLAVEARDRYQTALEMEEALIAAVRPASSSAVAAWLKGLGKEYLDKHDKVLAAEEASWRRSGAGSANASMRRAGITAEQRPPRAKLATIPPPEEAAASTPQTQPQPQLRYSRGPYALVALLSMLVVALAIGIVIVVRGSGGGGAPAAGAVSPGAPAAGTAAPSAPPAAPPAPAVAGEATVERGSPAISIGEAETSSAAPAAAARAPSVRPPQLQQRSSRSAKAAASPAAAEPPPAPPPPEAKPAAKESCSPPYYFEGSKKIFKPACL